MSAYSFDVSTAEFKEKVIDASLDVPVVVDFWAEWCGPCKVLKPLLEKLADEYKGRFLLAKVNSDENPELAGHFGVRSIPTVAAIVGGQIVDGFTGAQPEGKLRAFLERFVPPAMEEELDPLQVAHAAIAAGQFDEARRLLDETLEAQPDNLDALLLLIELDIAAGSLDQAEEVLKAVAGREQARASHGARIDALLARIALARKSGGGANLAALEQKVAAAPADHATRIALAEALAAAGDYRAAFEHLLASVRLDRGWNEAAARKTMLTLFDLLAADDTQLPLVREFRSQLARTLN